MKHSFIERAGHSTNNYKLLWELAVEVIITVNNHACHRTLTLITNSLLGESGLNKKVYY